MKKTVFFHVDMDSLETIFEAHGKNAISNGDHFFLVRSTIHFPFLTNIPFQRPTLL